MKNKITKFGSLLVVVLFVLFFAMPSLLALRDGTSTTATKVSNQSTKENQVKIGLLQFMDHPALDQIRQGIYDGLKERGYEDGDQIAIDYKNGQGDQNSLKMISDNFISNKEDMVVGIATASAQSLANAANGSIPVIMSAVSDPVSAGLVNSLEHPGANITGVTDAAPTEEQINLIQEVLPNIKTLGILYTSSETNVAKPVETAKKIAKEKGLNVVEATITNTNDLNQVAEDLAGKVDAIWIPNDNVIASAMNTLTAITDSKKIPIFPTADTMVADGGLATVGINQYQIGKDTANVIADIIQGKDTADYPVVKTTATALYYNPDTAKKLGITLPDNVLENGVER